MDNIHEKYIENLDKLQGEIYRHGKMIIRPTKYISFGDFGSAKTVFEIVVSFGTVLEAEEFLQYAKTANHFSKIPK